MANTSHIVVAQMKENGEGWHFTSFIAQFGIIFILVAWGLKYVFTPKTEQQKFLNALAIPGPKDKWFRWTRATLDSVQRSKELVDEGYQKYSKENSVFIMPSFDRGGFLVIPPKQLKKVYGLPENKLDAFSSQLTTIQAQYTVEDMDVLRNPFHAKILSNQLPKNLDVLTKGMAEEVALAFEKYWGSSTTWKSVPVWSTSASVIARSMNRVFVGAPLCRDEGFIQAINKHGTYVFASGFLINSLPWFIKSLAGKLVMLYGRRMRRHCLDPLLPLIKSRLVKYREHLQNPDYAWNAPQDAVQWAIEDSADMEDKFQDPYQIGHRVLLLNFASIHSTSLAVTNTLQDLFSSDPTSGAIDDIRDECIKVFTEYGGIWTRDGIAKLHLLDSAIKESMRYSSLSILGLPRRIDDPNGITLADNTHVPPGISIITPVQSIHLDPALHPKPNEYHPFRFCSPAQVSGNRNQLTQSTLARDTVSTYGDDVPADYKFIPFGFGRHACPGRFFALHQAKLMLAYALMNYDVEFMAKRPEMRRVLWVQTPLEEAEIRVRKREDAVWQTKFA